MLNLSERALQVTPKHQEWVITGRTVEESEPRTFPLTPLPFRIGRKSGLSLTLPRPTVSGLHAEFFERDGRVYVHDLGSTNGTFVNGQRLTGEWELQDNDLVQFADAPFRVARQQDEMPSHTRCKDTCDHALAMVQFENLLKGQALIPHYQPIVDIHTNQLMAFEVLARSRLIGLETPDFMFTAAAELGLTSELSRSMRHFSVIDSCRFGTLPHLFLNTHPSELEVAPLIESCRELRRLTSNQPLTIEIHEAAISKVAEMVELRQELELIGISLAFDDFGAGQARIGELAEVRPHYIKFDRSIIRRLHAANESRRRVVGGLVSMVKDVGIIPLAEGVEMMEERDACAELGFTLSQGYFHGRPMPVTYYQEREIPVSGPPGMPKPA